MCVVQKANCGRQEEQSNGQKRAWYPFFFFIHRETLWMEADQREVGRGRPLGCCCQEVAGGAISHRRAGKASLRDMWS